MREHHLTRRVLFYETDLAGIVHFSMYFRYFEEAEHALWRTAGLQIAPRDESIGFPRVSAHCDFFAPLHFEEEFDVHVRIEELGRRKIKYAFEITRGTQKIATGHTIVVCVIQIPGEPMRATDLPEHIAATLRSGT